MRKRSYAQLEECVGNLEHQNVRVAVVVDKQDALNRAAHSTLIIVVLQPLQPCSNTGVFLRLRFLGRKRKRPQRLEDNRRRHG